MRVRTEIEEIHNLFINNDRVWHSTATEISKDRNCNHEMANTYGFSFMENISAPSRGIVLHSIVNDENWNNPESVILMMNAYHLPYSRNETIVGELSYDYLSLRKEQGGVLASKCTESGFDCLKRNAIAESLRYFDEALRFDGSLVSALIGKAQAFLAIGRIKEAIVELNEALSIDDNSDTARRLLLGAYGRDAGLFTSSTTDARDTTKLPANLATGSSVSFIDKLRLSIGQKDGELQAEHKARAVNSSSDLGTTRTSDEATFLNHIGDSRSVRASSHERNDRDTHSDSSSDSSNSDDCVRSARKRRKRGRDGEKRTEKKRRSFSKRDRKKDSKKEKRKKERRRST